MNFEDFRDKLTKATTEEMVKATYASYFNIEYDTNDKHDLYTPEVLFEFKQDVNFENIKTVAAVLAQTLYYIRRLKYEATEKVIPATLCLADKNEAALCETVKWHTYYCNDSYDWDRAPSKPDPKLIDHLVKDSVLSNLHIFKILTKKEHETFKSKLADALNPQMGFGFVEKKSITEENFESVYEHWKDIVGKHIETEIKHSIYFLADMQRDRTIVDKESSRIVFTFEDNTSKTHKIMMKDYQYFWSLYEHVSDPDTIKGIHAKIDRLTDESVRRFEGEFYTPLIFAKKAIHYLEDVIGKKWYKTGKYRIWDMAAGTGNLEWHLPADAYKYLYISTLHASESDHNKKAFPGATCFQYDYLNDDIEYLFVEGQLPFEPKWKLPEKLRADLADKTITWIVYINPPFATAQVGGAKGENKKGVSKTNIEKYMDKEGVGHVKRELFAQFMFRITKELPTKTYLGMFSKLKYLNAPDSIEYRDNYFDYEYKKGFIFKSTNFHGVKGEYPIGFLIWDLSKKRNPHIRKIELDISNDKGINIGTKHLSLLNKEQLLNNWFERPSNSDEYILPPLSNGITVKEDNIDKRHRARPDFLASVCSNGNDFQHAKYVVMLSSPNASAGAFTVTEEIFEKSLVLHAVKKIPAHTWLNDRNQFLKPLGELDQEFINNCVIWSLFSHSNETTAMTNISYQGRRYDIRNNFFPFKIQELKKWVIKDPDFLIQLSNENDRFVSEWIHNSTLSAEANDVLEKGRQVYKFYFANLHNIPTVPYRITTWDAGWYQIRRSLTDQNLGGDLLDDLKNSQANLAKKIMPCIEQYGFLDQDEVYDSLD